MSAWSASAQCKVTDDYDVSFGQRSGRPLKPITVLAFGTSLMWGDGLKQENTFRHIVADWAASEARRPSHLVTFAHSAALLGPPEPRYAPNPVPELADLNDPRPTVDEQIRCAGGMRDLLQADLVLIEGCVNEVGAEDIAYPWTTKEHLRDETKKACDGPMVTELAVVRELFPRAWIVVVGYYPLVSDRSSLFGFSSTRRLARHAIKIHTAKHPGEQPAKTSRGRKEEHNFLVSNSEEFYQSSKDALTSAIDARAAAGDHKVAFAKLPEISLGFGRETVDPSYAYGAPQRHEWMVPVRFLFFFAFYKDQKYWYRQRLCAKHVGPGWQRLVCDSSPAFHPNLRGAETFAASIEAAVPRAEIANWKAR